MSYNCPVHNWNHIWQECPSCCSSQITTSNTTGPTDLREANELAEHLRDKIKALESELEEYKKASE